MDAVSEVTLFVKLTNGKGLALKIALSAVLGMARLCQHLASEYRLLEQVGESVLPSHVLSAEKAVFEKLAQRIAKAKGFKFGFILLSFFTFYASVEDTNYCHLKVDMPVS